MECRPPLHGEIVSTAFAQRQAIFPTSWLPASVALNVCRSSSTVTCSYRLSYGDLGTAARRLTLGDTPAVHAHHALFLLSDKLAQLSARARP